MPKEQIEYIVWGLLYEAIADQTNCRQEILITIGERLMEIERLGLVTGWHIVDIEHIIGGTD